MDILGLFIINKASKLRIRMQEATEKYAPFDVKKQQWYDLNKMRYNRRVFGLVIYPAGWRDKAAYATH